MKKNIQKSGREKNEVSVKWFIFILIIAVVLSSLVTLKIISYSASVRESSDRGMIVVDISEDTVTQQGQIVVEVKSDQVQK